ncbi:MAG TPA: GNAT family N-acetyltransferase [Reyranella sp.]
MNEPIRAATIADADAIAALHAASWRSAYRGILKETTLGPGLDAERRAHWRTRFAAMDPQDTVLIADGLGFIAAWAKGDPGFGAYIDNLHVHPDRRGAGLGRRLLGAAMRLVARRGEGGVYLWVFDANTRTIDFYRRLGGEIVEHGFDEIDGLKVPQSRIVWRDARRLAEACA